jgi:D-alanyl-D-alanine carboxypeptidase (penicillin-binding protein 5/6)
MIKKILTSFLTLSFIFLNLNQVHAQPSILSETAVLMDSKTGTVLAEKDSNKKMYPASLTKIMTAILALEKGSLTDVITVDNDTPYEIDGSHIALEPGEILTLKDLLYALMLPSANDAASTIAKHYGGSIDGFVEMMNKKAKELGAVNTNFANPHGLHDLNHYTTAYDLALITKYAMENESFREIVKTVKYEIRPTNKKSETRFFTTLNKLIYDTGGGQILINGAYISPYYEYATGVKTGYTPEAGNSLVACASKDGMELIAVTMKGISLEMYQDAHNLFNYGFSEYKGTTLINKNTFVKNIEIKNGDSKVVSLITESDLTALAKKDSLGKITSNIVIGEVSLPIEENEVLGKIEYSLDGKVIGAVNLISPASVKSTEDRRGGFLVTLLKSFAVLVLILISLLFILKAYNSIRVKLNRKRRQRRYNN